MVLSVLRISDPANMTSSGEGSQSTSLDDLNKPVKQCEQSLNRLRFAISYWWRIPSILFLKSHGLQLAWFNHRLVVFASHKYWLKFDNSRPAGI